MSQKKSRWAEDKGGRISSAHTANIRSWCVTDVGDSKNHRSYYTGSCHKSKWGRSYHWVTLNVAECLLMEYIHGSLFERHYQRNNGTGNHKANVSVQVK